MKIAVIGAGFTGLSAAYQLTKQNHQVIVFEKDARPGGLAIGYREKNWDWSLENHYHHWFTNDKSILDLAREIGYEVIIKRPKTSVLIKDKIYQLDSPLTFLTFPLLSLFERLRMSFFLVFLKCNPFWKPLEKYKASKILPLLMGKKSYQMIWEPLLTNKFGESADSISLAWFWARIKKRTPSLAYPKGGFLEFANRLVLEIEKNNGTVLFNAEIIELKSNGNIAITWQPRGGKRQTDFFDKAIISAPSFHFLKIAQGLPASYKRTLEQLKGLGATNVMLRLKEPFLKEGTYWLNICEKNSPVMAIVEHTNFMDKKYYDNEHIVYLGNYLPMTHPDFSKTKDDLLRQYDVLLQKINPGYKKNIIGLELFQAPFAQPIIPTNYSKMIPSFKTPLKNVYLANMQQVYPWDRGTNYAVELGKKVAKLILNNA